MIQEDCLTIPPQDITLIVMFVVMNFSKARKKSHKDVGVLTVEINLYVRKKIVCFVLKSLLRRINWQNTGVIRIP